MIIYQDLFLAMSIGDSRIVMNGGCWVVVALHGLEFTHLVDYGGL